MQTEMGQVKTDMKIDNAQMNKQLDGLDAQWKRRCELNPKRLAKIVHTRVSPGGRVKSPLLPSNRSAHQVYVLVASFTVHLLQSAQTKSTRRVTHINASFPIFLIVVIYFFCMVKWPVGLRHDIPYYAYHGRMYVACG